MASERERYDRLMGQLQTELGTDLMAAVMDDAVTGIKVGADGKLAVKRHSVAWHFTGDIFDEERRLRLLNIIAHELGKTLNAESSQLSGELPLTGSRIEGSVLPTSPATFVIRRHSSRIFTLDDYVKAGICERWQAELLRWHVLHKSNIVVGGAVDSGKTTITNALLVEIAGMEHVVCAEDTSEIRGLPENHLMLKTSAHVSMQDILRSVLRLDPDRVIVGEVRGAEALDAIRIWNAGRRGGVMTVHADDAAGVLLRLGQMCLEAGLAVIPWLAIQQAIDLIVYIKMTPTGRKITQIMEVNHEDLAERIPVGLKLAEPGFANGITQYPP